MRELQCPGTTLSVSGNVLDEHGDGLYGVSRIAVEPETSEAHTAATSDDDGKCVLRPCRCASCRPSSASAARIGTPGRQRTDPNTPPAIRMQDVAIRIGEAMVSDGATTGYERIRGEVRTIESI